MKLKSLSCLLALTFLFTFAANTSLEARHHCCRHASVQFVNVAPAYYPAPVVVVPAPVYYQPVAYYPQPVVVRERCCPAAGLFTSFALGLGFGLLAH